MLLYKTSLFFIIFKNDNNRNYCMCQDLFKSKISLKLEVVKNLTSPEVTKGRIKAAVNDVPFLMLNTTPVVVEI